MLWVPKKQFVGYVATPMVEHGSVSVVVRHGFVYVVSPIGVQEPSLEVAHVTTSIVGQGPTPAAISMVEHGVAEREFVPIEHGLAFVVVPGDGQESIPEVDVVPKVDVNLLVVLKGKASLHGCEANDPVKVVGSLDIPVQEPRLPRKASKGVANLIQSLKQVQKSPKKGRKKGKKCAFVEFLSSSP
ncbi:hypothetical protein V6N12_049051 [Hibiscus sabdariffa]|uniref:Uncharacterized protein n=1 Tax=Hibiscus sabdariffa TaxID=183260 RepID=A0ABR2EJF4_9ROSI